MAIPDFDKTVKEAVKTYLGFLSANHGGEEIQYRTMSRESYTVFLSVEA